VLAIGGLDTAILKSATLTDSAAARPLAPMLFQARFPQVSSVFANFEVNSPHTLPGALPRHVPACR